MEQFLIILQVIFAVVLISLILIQQGKGADAGASFGGGSSNTMFGAQGSFSFMFKLTAFLAFLFFANSIVITHCFVKQEKQKPINITSAPEPGPGSGASGAKLNPPVKNKGKIVAPKKSEK